MAIAVNGQFQGGSGVATLRSGIDCTGTVITTITLFAGGGLAWTTVTSPFMVSNGQSYVVCIRADNTTAPVIIRSLDFLWY